MPELAEVALFARDLNHLVQGKVIRKISFPNQSDWGSTIISFSSRKKLKALLGKNIAFCSTGKALQLFEKESAIPLLEFRLGMTGQFHLMKKADEWRRHYFLSISFDNQAFHYADPRRFGRILDPQEPQDTLGGFDRTRGFWTNSKIFVPDGFLTLPKIVWLLSNGAQTGVGNYMANEALGALNLSPYVPCRSYKEAEKILQKCRDIAHKSFKHGGNSFGSGYFLLNGKEGQYSKFCRFYQNPQIPRQIFRGRPVYSNFSAPNR